MLNSIKAIFHRAAQHYYWCSIKNRIDSGKTPFQLENDEKHKHDIKKMQHHCQLAQHYDSGFVPPYSLGKVTTSKVNS